MRDNRLHSHPTVIYGVTDCDGVVRYIGQSIRVVRRMKAHQRRFSWMTGYVVLETVVPFGDWATAEDAWIIHGRAAGWPLLNKAPGGAGPPWPYSADTRTRISQGCKGHRVSPTNAEMLRARNKSPEHRAKVSAAKKGRPLPLWQRAFISQLRKGTKLTEEHKRSISAFFKGRPLTEAHKAKLRVARARQVIKPFTIEHRANLSAAGKGRKPGPKSVKGLANISDAAKRQRGKKRKPYKARTAPRKDKGKPRGPVSASHRASLKRSWTPERRERERQRLLKKWRERGDSWRRRRQKTGDDK